ncbi:hypothetical protein J7443_10115 [Tropicibacter sp. R15_0]|uniref:hypothetical protein n=1 Tax=Tropicibacter sp. R15_0 TaxID=2821101 RepID=UPI001ADBA594|nr:hypothetical protein [Tropicibacter sp. R15_0]MBO9465581.1 hypothetical protein [Tropicibacter sp. R15_0]
MAAAATKIRAIRMISPIEDWLIPSFVQATSTGALVNLLVNLFGRKTVENTENLHESSLGAPAAGKIGVLEFDRLFTPQCSGLRMIPPFFAVPGALLKHLNRISHMGSQALERGFCKADLSRILVETRPKGAPL